MIDILRDCYTCSSGQHDASASKAALWDDLRSSLAVRSLCWWCGSVFRKTGSASHCPFTASSASALAASPRDLAHLYVTSSLVSSASISRTWGGRPGSEVRYWKTALLLGRTNARQHTCLCQPAGRLGGDLRAALQLCAALSRESHTQTCVSRQGAQGGPTPAGWCFRPGQTPAACVHKHGRASGVRHRRLVPNWGGRRGPRTHLA